MNSKTLDEARAAQAPAFDFLRHEYAGLPPLLRHPSPGVHFMTVRLLDFAPFPAGFFSGTGNESKTRDLAGYLSWGKNKPVLFFLQGRCAACMQEFELLDREYEALKKRNVETTSGRTKDAETTRKHENTADGVKFPYLCRGLEARTVQSLPGKR